MRNQRPSKHPDQWIGETFAMKIDRPIGSKHPRYASILYELNYGYIPQTIAADGSEVDAYLLGVNDPVERFEGQCIAIIFRQDDLEDKLIIAPIGQNFSDEEIMKLTNFQEQFFNSILIR
ncbi:MAG: inorganic diphosphatase [Pseudomonadota bacterium]